MNKCKKIIIPILIIAMFFCIIPKTENAAENKRKIGDINGDGIINSIDTLRILEHIAASTISKIKQKRPEWILTGDKLKAADINGDGNIDSRDTLRVLEYIAASTIPKIAQKHPEWIKYIESKWKIEATGITLNSTSITIEKGKTSKLIATVKPTNASNKIVTWSSSDKKVATVDGIGNVTGKNVGVTIITAKLSNGLAKTCKVTVKEATKIPTKHEPTTPTPTKPTVKIKNISSVSAKLSKTSLTYNGKVQTPAVILKDGKTTLTKGKDYLVSYANNKNVGTATVIIIGKGKYTGKVTKTFKINKATYNTKNLKFANVTVIYDGNKHSIKATGVPAGVKVTYTGNEKTSVGTYKITAKFVGDSKNYNTIKERKATLKIKAKSISKTTITGIQNKSYTGKAITQNIVIKDGNRILKNVTDYTVKYENNIKIGNNAKVVITGKGNYTGKVIKRFSINTVKVTRLIASAPMWRQIEKGKFGQLRAKVSPDNATNKTITWTSSNTKVVKVNKSGTIHVVGNGTAKITATHKESGLSVTYTIVGYTPAKSISLNKITTTVNKGSTEKLTVSFNPTTTSSKEVNWTSSNPNIVSVSSSKTTNGSVTILAKAKGTAIITATSKYGKIATCKVIVQDKVLYVSKNGSDSNKGTTPYTAFKTIRKGISQLSAGYTLMVGEGTYFENDLSLSKIGTSSNPIKIVANGNVVIDGSGKKRLLKIQNTNNVIIDGFTFQNLHKTDAKGIIIYPSTENIVISNCKFNNIKTANSYGKEDGASAIFINGSSSKPINNVVIKNCTLTNIEAGWSEAISVDGNCTNITIAGVKLTSSGIKGNIGICICGNYGTCSDKSLDRPRNVTISNCDVSNCKSPYDPGSAYGIYVDGGKDVTISNNTVSNCEGGIEIGAEQKNSKLTYETENIKVLNNTIKSCGIGAQIGGWDGKAIVYNVVFDNNKLLDCGHGDGKAIEFSRCKKVTISSCKFDTNQNKWFEGSSMAHNIMKFNNSKL